MPINSVGKGQKSRGYLSILIVCMFAVHHAAVSSSRCSGQSKPLSRTSAPETFRPTFEVEPLVVRKQGRPGQVIPFQFEIVSGEVALDLEVLPAALSQKPDGSVVPGNKPLAQSSIRLNTPSQIHLPPRSRVEVHGTWAVPNDRGHFASTGLFVSERQNTRAFPASDSTDSSRNLTMTILTRYLIRLEAEIRQPNPNAKHVDVQSAKLVAGEDETYFSVQVSNQSSLGQTFDATVSITGITNATKAKPVNLHTMIQLKRPPERRRRPILLPESMVELRGVIDTILQPGQYEAELKLTSHRKTLLRATLPLEVVLADFAKQREHRLQAGDGLEILPNTITLSSLRGGLRRLPLKFVNSGTQSFDVQLSSAGKSQPLTQVRPDSFVLRPGRARNVVVSFRGGELPEENRKETIDVVIKPLEGDERTLSIPVTIEVND